MQLLLKSMEADVCCRIFRKTWFLTNEKKVNASLNVAALHKIAPPDSTGAVLWTPGQRETPQTQSKLYNLVTHQQFRKSKICKHLFVHECSQEELKHFQRTVFFFLPLLRSRQSFSQNLYWHWGRGNASFFLQATKQMIEFAYIFHTCVLWDMQGVDLCRAH